MTDKQMIPINDPKDIPSGMSDEERAEFWDTHEVTEEFLAKTEEVPVDERPSPRDRAKPVSIRLDTHTVDRLKRLAETRGVGYQTLLKDFVKERLYEEEIGEGMVRTDRPSGDYGTIRDVVMKDYFSPGFQNALSHLMASPTDPIRHLKSYSPGLHIYRYIPEGKESAVPQTTLHPTKFTAKRAARSKVAVKNIERGRILLRKKKKRTKS